MAPQYAEAPLPSGIGLNNGRESIAATGSASQPWPVSPARASRYLACAILGYIGIYLCRKNLSVALPLIQTDFGISKAQAGIIASYSTIAYAVGKIVFGPVIDRYGGRICFLLALVGVALFCGLETSAVSLPMFTILYSANRFCGAAGWGSMVKQVPDWFPRRHLGMAMAFLSQSFVFGGVFAVVLAGELASMSHDRWRVIIGVPALILVAILILSWLVLPRPAASSSRGATRKGEGGFRAAQMRALFRSPQFWIVCALSFVLTITRETFNVWTVDFIKTEGGPQMTSQVAAFLSTPFDAAGAVGILFLGWILDRLTWSRRRWLLFTMLGALACLIYILPHMFRIGLWQMTAVIGLIGFLSYGPYSLLAGVFAVEVCGKDNVGTAAGLIDASGYLAGIVSGYCFGMLLDKGGYWLGFHFLAVVTVAAALLCLFLGPAKPSTVSISQ